MNESSESRENPTSTDWLTTRGERWASQLSGMEAMLAPVDGPLIDALALDAPYRIAEIGCGGGGTAFTILQRAPEGSVVHGYDISPALVARARARLPAGEQRIAFDTADMSSAAAPTQPFARLASRFSLMFFDEPSTAFSNVFSFLAPGGRFSCAVWGPLVENPWIGSVREAVATVIDVPRPDPDAPGPFRYADAEKFVALLERTGLRALDVHSWRGQLAIGGGLTSDAAATFALSSFSNFGELLTEAGAGQYDQGRATLSARYAQHVRDGVVSMDACVHIVTGRRA